MTASVIAVHDLSVVRDGRTILAIDDLAVGVGERWVVLGANGSGKTTFLTICAARLLPTSGTVDLLGERVGRVDLRQLRARIGLVSSALTRQLRTDLSALDVVIGGLDGSLEPWWRTTTTTEVDAARATLDGSVSVHWRTTVSAPSPMASGNRSSSPEHCSQILLSSSPMNRPQDSTSALVSVSSDASMPSRTTTRTERCCSSLTTWKRSLAR